MAKGLHLEGTESCSQDRHPRGSLSSAHPSFPWRWASLRPPVHKEVPRVAGAAWDARLGALAVARKAAAETNPAPLALPDPLPIPCPRPCCSLLSQGPWGWAGRVGTEGLEPHRLQEPRGEDQLPLSYERDKGTSWVNAGGWGVCCVMVYWGASL